MKIRTDFVTNSSSSSYAVEICVKNKQNKTVEFCTQTDEDISVFINENDVLELESPDKLNEMISQDIYFQTSDMEQFNIQDVSEYIERTENEEEDEEEDDWWDSDDDGNDEDDDYDDEDYEENEDDFLDDYTWLEDELEEFRVKLKRKVKKVSEIEEIKIAKRTYRRGESCKLEADMGICYRNGENPDEIRKYIEEKLALDSDIDGIMACVEKKCEALMYYTEEATIINFATKKIKKTYSIKEVVHD